MMFFPVCHGQRPYPAQSDITSGSLVAAAGSIGVMALAGFDIAHFRVFFFSGTRCWQVWTFLWFTFQRRCNFELSRLFFMGVTKLGEKLVKESRNYIFE